MTPKDKDYILNNNNPSQAFYHVLLRELLQKKYDPEMIFLIEGLPLLLENSENRSETVEEVWKAVNAYLSQS